MIKKVLGAFVVLSLIATTIIAGCTGHNTSTDPNPVHLGDANFKVLSITIKKGEKITLINDSVEVHIISNGTWENSTPHPKLEPGAPKINIQVDGNSSRTIGPFNTAGTFNIYCTIHTGMAMTVLVK
ncbi:MAG TPA: plastocyanin/azurin family copper-binding protein [Ktedonobacteraceae bacterium]|jgi:plastocyanin|nr:plastocyanin/azurin family copper-binding protein [Ktedonobacteraceae bacterium]